jgi:hypothetical protein
MKWEIEIGVVFKNGECGRGFGLWVEIFAVVEAVRVTILV